MTFLDNNLDSELSKSFVFKELYLASYYIDLVLVKILAFSFDYTSYFKEVSNLASFKFNFF